MIRVSAFWILVGSLFFFWLSENYFNSRVLHFLANFDFKLAWAIFRVEMFVETACSYRRFEGIRKLTATEIEIKQNLWFKILSSKLQVEMYSKNIKKSFIDYIPSHSFVSLYFADGRPIGAVTHSLPFYDSWQFTKERFASTIVIVDGPLQSRVTILQAESTFSFTGKEWS